MPRNGRRPATRQTTRPLGPLSKEQATLVVTGLIAKSVGPAINRALARSFLGIASRAVASMQPEIYGTVAGSVVDPGLGTFAGWILGASGGLLLDLRSNRANARVVRADLQQASSRAVTRSTR